MSDIILNRELDGKDTNATSIGKRARNAGGTSLTVKHRYSDPAWGTTSSTRELVVLLSREDIVSLITMLATELAEEHS